MKLVCRERVLSLDRVAVMGVLNVTPDSFSDGGLWLDPGAAVAHAREMIEAGAAIVDVGGESTRPGAAPVPEAEELNRVIPVVRELAREDVIVSIDTRKPAVARAALDSGASIVNDTTGEEPAPEMDELAAATGAGIVVMHSRGTPTTMRSLNVYEDVVGDVRAFLLRRALELEAAGVPHDSIALDPGFGFAKDPGQNLLLLNRLDEIMSLDYPVLVGTSRKSFIGWVLDLPEGERLEGTAATVAWALSKGARLVRVHDVEATARVVRMTEAILDAAPGPGLGQPPPDAGRRP
jgi:dihydropteroate synthase